MYVAIGADHRGFVQKELLKKRLSELEWLDVGAHNKKRSDYPVFGRAVAEAVLAGQAERGILLCGSGVGMAIVANRYRGIYAGVSWTQEVATHARRQDNVNILVIPSDFVSNARAVAMVRAWLAARFAGGRYQKRLQQIDRAAR